MIRILAPNSMGMILGADCLRLACFLAMLTIFRHHSLSANEVIKSSSVGENINNSLRMHGSDLEAFVLILTCLISPILFSYANKYRPFSNPAFLYCVRLTSMIEIIFSRQYPSLMLTQ